VAYLLYFSNPQYQNKSSAVAEMAAQCCVDHFLLVINTDVLSRTVSKLSRSIF